LCGVGGRAFGAGGFSGGGLGYHTLFGGSVSGECPYGFESGGVSWGAGLGVVGTIAFAGGADRVGLSVYRFPMRRSFVLGLLVLLFQGVAFGETGLKILAIGDSTTAGTPGFRSSAEAPPDGEGDVESQYAFWMMKEHSEWNIVNRGINGERSDEILARLEEELETFKPDVVIILAGVIDLYQGGSAESVKANLARMYEISRQRKIKIVSCTILPYNLAQRTIQARIQEVNDWIREYSRDHNLIFCDTFKAAEDPLNSFHLKESPDGLHPSVKVYRQMGEAIASVITTGGVQ